MKTLLAGAVSLLLLSHTTYAQTDITGSEMVRNDLENFARSESSRTMGSVGDSHHFVTGTVPTFTPKEETVGSRYLFDKWVHGAVTSVVDSVYADPNILFNYNKVAHTLIMTKDKKTAIELYLERIKSFILKSDDQEYHFERVPVINDKDFFITLVRSDTKYSFYKLVNTKFTAADYSTNGLVETGNKYDEFKDNTTYYVVLNGGKEFKKIELKSKSIKSALKDDASKVNDYFSKNSDAEVNEKFVTGLITSLNQ